MGPSPLLMDYGFHNFFLYVNSRTSSNLLSGSAGGRALFPLATPYSAGHGVRRRIVQDDAFERVAIVVPCGPLHSPHRIAIACLPALTNATRAEVDILGVIFIIEPRRQQPYDVHLCPAAVLGQVLDDRVVALTLGYEPHQLRYD